MTAQELATRLHGVKRSGGELKALCPSHDDKTASLAVRDGDKGVIVKCFAGCTAEAITAAVGLTVADLFTEKKKPAQVPVILTTYDYTDEAGALLYQVVRFIPKDFRQRRPDGTGDWVWKLDGVRRVLYGLPALQGQASVIVVEGERDVQTLTEQGFAATTNAGGAGKWLDDYSQQLTAAGVKRVIVIPDNDPPGHDHAEKVQVSCRAAGLTVKIVALAGLPKGDVSDWFQAGHTADELRRVIDAPPALHGITPIAEAVAGLLDSLDHAAPTFMSTPFPNLNRLLCGGLIPGELYYLAAKGGEGKSALAIELARYVSKNHGVLVVSQEMGLTAIVRRFLAQEAQVSATKLRQHNLTEVDWGRLTAAAGRLYGKRIWLADHAPTVKAIESKLDQLDGVELILVDYLQLLRGDGKDSRAQIEAISKGLRDLSKQRQVAIFALSAVSARGDGRDKPSMHWLRGCVTGDTMVALADGTHRPIASLVNTTPTVSTLDEQQKLTNGLSDAVWSIGRREVYRIVLASGRTVAATADHRFLRGDGWVHLRDIKVGDRIAVARSLPEPSATMLMDEDRVALLAHLIGDGCYVSGGPVRYTDILESDELQCLATNDIFWDRVITVQDAGQQEVYDLTVPDTANWIANGIISHNSGMLEHDPDVILLLHQPHPPDPARELIIVKARDAQCGTVKLHFAPEIVHFIEQEDRRDDPYS